MAGWSSVGSSNLKESTTIQARNKTKKFGVGSCHLVDRLFLLSLLKRPGQRFVSPQLANPNHKTHTAGVIRNEIAQASGK